MVSLIKLNWGLGALHLIMAIFLTIWYNSKGYFDKYRKLYIYGLEVGANSELEPTLDEHDKMYIAKETVSFFYITAFFHFFYGSNIGCMYSHAIKQKNNYFRWIEYSITATLMIRIISVQAGVRDEKTLGLLTANTIGLMLQGQIVEANLAMIMSNKKDPQDAWKSVFTSTMVGWVLLFANFSIIISSFVEQVNDVNNLDCNNKVPNFVYGIVWTQLIFYLSFGLIQLYQIYSVWKGRYNYVNIEKLYIWDSLLSKVTLGIILAYSVIGSEKGEDSKCETKAPVSL